MRNRLCFSCNNFNLTEKTFCKERRERDMSRACPNYAPFRNRGNPLGITIGKGGRKARHGN